MNNWQKEKIKNSFYDYVRSIGDEIIINNTIIYIENLLEETKKEERYNILRKIKTLYNENTKMDSWLNVQPFHDELSKIMQENEV